MRDGARAEDAVVARRSLSLTLRGDTDATAMPTAAGARPDNNVPYTRRRARKTKPMRGRRRATLLLTVMALLPSPPETHDASLLFSAASFFLAYSAFSSISRRLW